MNRIWLILGPTQCTNSTGYCYVSGTMKLIKITRFLIFEKLVYIGWLSSRAMPKDLWQPLDDNLVKSLLPSR